MLRGGSVGDKVSVREAAEEREDRLEKRGKAWKKRTAKAKVSKKSIIDRIGNKKKHWRQLRKESH